MALPTYDESHWPLLLVTMPAAIDGGELGVHHRLLGEYIARKQVFAMVVDSRNMPPLGPDERRASADFIKQHSEVAKEIVAAVALVHSRSLQTKILTAILWLVKPPVLLRVFDSVDEARDWANDKLRTRGVKAV